ncbi:hypothetical protein ACQZV8_05155 [Magnetococcales bacterium HHB-1]
MSDKILLHQIIPKRFHGQGWNPLNWREGVDEHEQMAKKIQSLYWIYRLALAKSDGEIEAWEGIRLVREQD